ncbi:hypothetical protein D3C71_876450 [compost metagenome]
MQAERRGCMDGLNVFHPLAQGSEAKGFEQAVIHSGLFAALYFFRLGVGGKTEHGAGRAMVLSFVLTNGTGQLVTVHDRHVAIGDHQIKRLVFPCLQSLLAIGRDGKSMA